VIPTPTEGVTSLPCIALEDFWHEGDDVLAIALSDSDDDFLAIAHFDFLRLSCEQLCLYISSITTSKPACFVVDVFNPTQPQ
jgi:hypothetical protein